MEGKDEGAAHHAVEIAQDMEEEEKASVSQMDTGVPVMFLPTGTAMFLCKGEWTHGYPQFLTDAKYYKESILDIDRRNHAVDNHLKNPVRWSSIVREKVLKKDDVILTGRIAKSHPLFALEDQDLDNDASDAESLGEQ